LSASESGRLLEAFCEKFAEIDDALSRRHALVWHGALICSSEHFTYVEALKGGASLSPYPIYRVPKGNARKDRDRQTRNYIDPTLICRL
jgi:hypothetical protein